mmetsp:Transcript_3774/g.6282  ORF Transcript_3774/g.6282 Transcript_3774/m.6282 type:complete len:89 (+) Transcript_3774:584-850(+)
MKRNRHRGANLTASVPPSSFLHAADPRHAPADRAPALAPASISLVQPVSDRPVHHIFHVQVISKSQYVPQLALEELLHQTHVISLCAK